MSVNEEGLEITTGEAARILNISRPQLIKQLEAGALAYQMFGSHRRIRLSTFLHTGTELMLGLVRRSTL